VLKRQFEISAFYAALVSYISLALSCIISLEGDEFHILAYNEPYGKYESIALVLASSFCKAAAWVLLRSSTLEHAHRLKELEAKASQSAKKEVTQEDLDENGSVNPAVVGFDSFVFRKAVTVLEEHKLLEDYEKKIS